MAEMDGGAGPADAEDEVQEPDAEVIDEVVPDASVADEPDAEVIDEVVPDASVADEPGAGSQVELRAMRARKTLEEEAEAARRRVLGGNRGGRARPATLTGAEPDDVEPSEHLRQLVRGVEEETERLQENIFRLRSAAGRAGETLQEEIQRAADELAEAAVTELESAVEQTATESLATLTAAVDNLHETAAALNEAAAGLRTSVEQLGRVAPMAEQLAKLAAAPPALPDALAGILRDLTDQLSELSDAVSAQVRGSVEEMLATELGRYEARIEHALGRLVDEIARLRRRLPVTKRGTSIEFSQEQLTGIGQAVGDHLLAAMREQKT
jgi:hypothetical protein